RGAPDAAANRSGEHLAGVARIDHERARAATDVPRAAIGPRSRGEGRGGASAPDTRDTPGTVPGEVRVALMAGAHEAAGGDLAVFTDPAHPAPADRFARLVG